MEELRKKEYQITFKWMPSDLMIKRSKGLEDILVLKIFARSLKDTFPIGSISDVKIEGASLREVNDD